MKIKKDVFDKIIAHAKKDAPVEACGYLAAKDGVVLRHYELTNRDKSHEHFSFDPREQFAAVRDARANGCVVSAVYHSHPASPARPSAEDIKLARDPQASYVIVSLINKTPEVKSFRIMDAKVETEVLEVIGDE